jgi:hypothetical protein
VPDIEFIIQTLDNGFEHGAPWVLGRRETEEGLVLMPDYSFYSYVSLFSVFLLYITELFAHRWPEPGVRSMQDVADRCRRYESNLRWEDKVDKLFFRGAPLAPIRKELYQVANNYSWGT